MKRLQGLTEQRSLAAGQKRRVGFARSEDGSFIIFGLFIFVMILIVGGLGVDLMRYETERARLQATIDRAVLAAAHLDQDLDPKKVVLDYVQRAGLGEHITEDDITVVSNPFTRKVDVDVRMDVPSIFLNLVGIHKLDAPARAAAQQLAAQTEISLVLDVSTSMGSTASGTTKSRVEVLQDSAETFLNMVLCDPSDATKTTDCTVPRGSVAVNIVPYSEQVLVGEELLGYLNVTDEHNFSSCVQFDADDYLTSGISDTTALKRSGHFDARSGRAWSWYGVGDWRDPSDWTCKTDSWRQISAFEDNLGTLQDKVEGLRGTGGYTSIDIGMKWGAALLDPDLQPVVADMIADDVVDEIFENYPLSWTEKGVQKVIVLMTDGVNTDEYYLYDNYRNGLSVVWRTNEKVDGEYIYSVYDEDSDQYYWPHEDEWEDHAYGTGTYTTCGWWTCTTHDEGGDGAERMTYPELWANKTWQWYEQFDFLNDPGQLVYDKDDRFDDICDAAKDEGMKIFTIGFDTTWTQETLLKTCASKPGYYFDADGLNLEDIFAEIAREVSKLRLVN